MGTWVQKDVGTLVKKIHGTQGLSVHISAVVHESKVRCIWGQTQQEESVSVGGGEAQPSRDRILQSQIAMGHED